jgi:uncharacterized protein
VISRRALAGLLLGLAAVFGLASCAVTDTTQYYTLGGATAASTVTDTTQYYTLGGATAASTVSRPEPAAAASTASRADASTPRRSMAGTRAAGVGVGPFIMPGYLDRTQIVTRPGTDHVEISMFNRWAEPLEDGISRILAEEISARVPTERVVMFPWRGVVARVIQYQVVVAVVRFDGRPGGDVTLDTRWRILDREGDELVFRRSTVVEPAAGRGYEPVVAAMTRAVMTLGQEIAAEIRPISR